MATKGDRIAENHPVYGEVAVPMRFWGELGGTLPGRQKAQIDAFNLEADIERVCPHSRCRRRGLARMVIEACMLRLRDMGLHKAHIAGYSPAAIDLYPSLGDGRQTTFYIRGMAAP